MSPRGWGSSREETPDEPKGEAARPKPADAPDARKAPGESRNPGDASTNPASELRWKPHAYAWEVALEGLGMKVECLKNLKCGEREGLDGAFAGVYACR